MVDFSCIILECNLISEYLSFLLDFSFRGHPSESASYRSDLQFGLANILHWMSFLTQPSAFMTPGLGPPCGYI